MPNEAQQVTGTRVTHTAIRPSAGSVRATFASGKTQNVHELMISLQKAGLAMDMTSAVRNKVMNAYQELMRIQF